MMETEILSNLILNDEFLKSIWWQSPYEFKLGEYFLKQSGIVPLQELIHQYFFNPQIGGAIFMLTVEGLEPDQFYKMGILNVDIVNQIANKFTLKLDQFTNANLFYNNLAADMCEKLTRYFGKENSSIHFFDDTDVFISLTKTFGFIKHSDEIDVFSFQQSGKVEWKVWDITGKQLLFKSVQEPGDIIYIPKGFYHEVKRLTGNECHISLGIDTVK